MHHIGSPIDSHPTDQLLSLYSRLRRLTGKKTMLGHQDTTLCRRMHECDSDVATLTGAYPAIWGFDLGRIELGWEKNIDDVSFAHIHQEVLHANNIGAIPTLTWHSVNPVTGGGYGSNIAPGSVRAVLPGGDCHGRFLDWLDRVATMLNSLTDDDNLPIPVVFRPFHEHNGTWFWWSLGSPMQATDTSEEEFRQLWRMSIDYLRNSRGIHHVLYAYSPDRSRIDLTNETAMTEEYLYGYPGDDYVDVLGIDDYWDMDQHPSSKSPTKQHEELITMLTLVGRLAEERGKLAAATEIGSPGAFASRLNNGRDGEDLYDSRPWTGYLLSALEANQFTTRMLWCLPWRNSLEAEGTGAYGTPSADSPYAQDFIDFAGNQRIVVVKESTKSPADE